MYHSGSIRAVIIGSGRVGSHCAMSLITRHIVDEVVLIDSNASFAAAQATDLADFATGMGSTVTVRMGTYSDCNKASFVLITAGRGRRPGETRLDLLRDTFGALQDISIRLSATSFDGMVVCVTNPVDIATEYLYHRLSLPSSQILGTGTSLDTIRLKRILSTETGVDYRQVHVFCMGEHGDSSFVAWSHVSIGGVPLSEFETTNPDTPTHLDRTRIQDEIHSVGGYIIGGKGCTEFGIGSVVTDLLFAVSHNQTRVLPLSVHLDGQYGRHDLSIGTPCVVGGQGIQRVIEVGLLTEEYALMQKSCDIVQHKLAETLL